MTQLLLWTFYGTILAWVSKPGHYLAGYTSKGHYGGQYRVFDEAKKQCLALPMTDCGGITMYKQCKQCKTWYQLRKGPTPAKSLGKIIGENSWLRPLATTGITLLYHQMRKLTVP